MKIKNIFKKFFPKRHLADNPEKPQRPPKRPKGFERELEDLKLKLTDFLLTLKVNSGLVVKRNMYSLTKNGHGLYRLEGIEKTGRAFSIIVSTANHLQLNAEGKVTGLIQVNEAELNRVIQNEYSSLKAMFDKFRNLNLNDKALEILDEKNKFNWKEIILWNRYWKEMLFLHMSANHIALLIISLGDSFKNVYLEVATKKQKQIISDELFYLNQGVNSEEMNPNSKNLNLMNFDIAMEEFKKSIQKIKKKMDLES
ncbi:MAG TPA: hypothetical protein PK079_10055 [Leptospiraceae bacterium]|nr:hypothetical protein [Leptospiraceae bacterium]HMW06676.1 hypothetical protein [Leptospiraceae bacterium]HMX34120.1 hypothetical protein [Leptospiraceae bacterium]HMY33597.1 hypothetical protein [Leptospiraceae bacterium]HMZ64928.1 hypothetical protein [Leptospiraceae bacterium]